MSLFKSHIIIRAALCCLAVMASQIPSAAFLNDSLVHPVSGTDNTVYMDLSKGDVTIDGTSYSGKKNDGSVVSASNVECSNILFYIYMSNGNQNNRYPQAVVPNLINIVNPSKDKTGESSVLDIINQWNALSESVRKRSPYRISVTGGTRLDGKTASEITIIVDNCFSTWHESGQGRVTGGIAYRPAVENAKLEVRLRGDNRFGNVFYTNNFYDASSASQQYDHTQLIFTSYSGNGKSDGTMTVADIDPTSTWDYNVYGAVTYNWYDSVIGGSDNDNVQNSRGIVINGGTIYAGALSTDNCSAIGGGGNGVGNVEITGGIVTAVTSSTGTAIGGGIGWTAMGGEAHVTISGNSQVYAYNHGFAINYNNTGVYRYVPATAIGGGSSFEVSCYDSDVTITGNAKVYAQSKGGVAIGGGGSGRGNAGTCTVTIGDNSGDVEVWASNIGGTVVAKDNYVLPDPIDPGASIGGGTGGDGSSGAEGNGGDATVTLYKCRLTAGSIGGGATNNPGGDGKTPGLIGKADVFINEGADVQGQFMMQRSQKHCTFTMDGGIIHNDKTKNVSSDPKVDKGHYNFLQTDGGALWMQDGGATATINGGQIYGCTANNGGAIYMAGGEFTMTGGIIGSNETGKPSNTANWNGGALFLGDGTVTISGGKILNNTATYSGGGVYVEDGQITVDSNYEVSGNHAYGTRETDSFKDGGGGLYIKEGKVSLNAGTIKDNTTSNNGGGLCVQNGTVSVTDGNVLSNIASVSGGGIYVADGKVTLNTGVITGNTAEGDGATKGGGGVFISNDQEFVITDGTISGNNATKGSGGGIYVVSGDVSIERATMESNTAAMYGGALCVVDGDMTISTGKVLSNGADLSGGGIYVANGKLAFSNGYEITGNSAKVNGGGLYVGTGEVELHTGSITGNTADGSGATDGGGGLYILDANKFVISNGTINGNNATNGSGGGIYVVSGNVNMTTASIDSNNSKDSGGGLRVDSGDVIATDATVDGNTAQHNGGGIYVLSGNVKLTRASSSQNQAYDGGGLWSNGGEIILIDNCSICYNVVTHHGGGVYANGGEIKFQRSTASVMSVVPSLRSDNSSDSDCSKISFNQACNGGGIYMARGASMTVVGALLNDNKAVLDPNRTEAIPKSAYWGYSGEGGKVNLQGIGGGVYLDSGISKEQKTSLVFDVSTIKKLGIFLNEATTAADDIFANGEYTYVEIPDVEEMFFEGFQGKPTGWYEDYMENDTCYPFGTYENNRNGSTGARYRASFKSGMATYKVMVKNVNVVGRYVSLALGDPFAVMKIVVKGLSKGENAIITLRKAAATKISYYILFTGTANGAPVSRIIKNIAIGDWVGEPAKWTWKKTVSPAKWEGEVAYIENDIVTATFEFSADPSKEMLESEAAAVNEFNMEVTAIQTSLNPREENETLVDL